jgi:molybdopterin-guanine dinucleotide biosynthesis protein MobB
VKTSFSPPVVSVVGWSRVGKTTLLERLIPELRRRGFRVGTIKHHNHNFELDRPGKDSWRHKQAGASISVISSPYQIGMVMDVDHDCTLNELLGLFSGVDIVLTEGYKQGHAPKMEVFRSEIHKEPLCRNDKDLVALVSDTDVDMGVPRFSPYDAEGLANFLIKRFRLSPAILTSQREAAS